MARPGGQRYNWRYGYDRDDRARRMLAGQGPGHPIPGIPPPFGPPGQDSINGVQFTGYIESETPESAIRNFLRVRSQRNADCESYTPWSEPSWKIYRVYLTPDLQGAINCNCPDAQNGFFCKHMRLIDDYLATRVLVQPRRSARVRTSTRRYGYNSTNVGAVVGAQIAPHKKKTGGYLCAQTPSPRSRNKKKKHGHLQSEAKGTAPPRPRKKEARGSAQKSETQTLLSDLF